MSRYNQIDVGFRIEARWLAAGVVAALLAIVACSSEKPAAHTALKAEQDRRIAPNFELKDASGNIAHLADYHGKVVLLDFWATWCGPCGEELPWFIEFEKKYRERGFEVLGVSMDDDGWKVVTPFVRRQKINYRVLLGDDHTGDQYGGIVALPTTFMIDRQGRIAAVHIGLTGKKDFENAIEQLLETGADAVHTADSDPLDIEPGGGNARRSDEPDSDGHSRSHASGG